MAGVHQLWTYDPATDRIEVAAGTTNEGLVDGHAADAWFAQPSGLSAAPATSGGGRGRLWVADSETSALRWVERTAAGDGEEYAVRTAVGAGLFDFGHRDGPAGQALLQHPLGVTALPDGSVAVSDTYNNALRRYDPLSGEVTTLATDLCEPSDAVVVEGDVVVVESAGHRLTRMRLPEEAVRVDPVAHRTRRAATAVSAGAFRLDVVFSAPAGQKLDERYGPSTRLLVSSSPPELLKEGAGKGTDLFRDLVLDPGVPEGVLHVAAMAATCDEPTGGTSRLETGGLYAACHVHQQDWGVPVRLTDDGDSRLALVLAGLDEPRDR
jgi:hypothetical protein